MTLVGSLAFTKEPSRLNVRAGKSEEDVTPGLLPEEGNMSSMVDNPVNLGWL
jgi:hypothetical protein